MPKKKNDTTRKMSPRAAMPMHERTGDVERPTMLGLTLLPSGHIISTELIEDITIGRQIPSTSALSHIDLSSFKAHQSGVSRLHARIILKQKGIAIQDLGSTNGTYINGYKLQPFVDMRLEHGDMLEVGKMKFKVSFLAKASV